MEWLLLCYCGHCCCYCNCTNDFSVLCLLLLLFGALPVENLSLLCQVKINIASLSCYSSKIQVLSVSGDEELAVSMSEDSETLDHHMEVAQKATPVLPHFQYTRVNFELHITTLLCLCMERCRACIRGAS